MSTDNKKYFAGIDLGTSGCRLMVIDADKRVQSSAVVAYDDPDKQTPELWWDSVSQLLKNLPSAIKQNLQSIAVDGTSGTILLVDDNGEPLTQALMYNDLRATAEAEVIKQVLPKENGGQGASGSLARLMWLLKYPENLTENLKNDHVKVGGCTTAPKHTPPLLHDDLNISTHAVHQADYILGKLANNYKISDENNCLKLGYDVINQCWPMDDLKKLGVDESLLPNVFPAGTAVAQIEPKQAENLGLPKSLQLVTGTTDSIAAFIATGADKLGEAVTSLGSTLVLKLISDQPIFSPKHGIYSHRLANQWLVGGASNAGAKVLRHYFSQAQIDEMTPQLSPEIPTGLDYYPLIKVGERFPVADTTKQPKLLPRPESDIEFFQGILEGIATIENQGYQKLMDLGAPAVKSVRSVGGGSKNKAWTRIRENMLKVDMLSDIRESEYIEAAYGSALLALKGLDETCKMKIKQKIIETERLVLRPIDLDDASTVQKFAGNYNVAKMTMNIPHPYEDGMAEAWIETQDKRWEEDELINFAIVNKRNNQLMGVVGLVGREEKAGGIGYWIGEPFWGKGYCTEATKAFIDFCFKHLNIERLEAEYLVTNPASGRVMEKAGMAFKTARTIKDRDGNDAELNVYEIKKMEQL